ncbi:MAG: CNNM domain-containing protein, partial [Chloroflexota bacterium]
MGVLEIVYLLVALLFLVICAFFASAEIGFINLQRFWLKHMQEEGVPGAERVARIMEHP